MKYCGVEEIKSPSHVGPSAGGFASDIAQDANRVLQGTRKVLGDSNTRSIHAVGRPQWQVHYVLGILTLLSFNTRVKKKLITARGSKLLQNTKIHYQDSKLLGAQRAADKEVMNLIQLSPNHKAR
jgi:hypothetical protein